MSETMSTSNDSNTDNNPKGGDEIFSDILTKLRSLEVRSKNQELRKSTSKEGATFLMELINLMEEHKNDMTDENYLAAKNGFNLIITSWDNMDMSQLLKGDSDHAYDIFYSYFDLFMLSGMKNYLKSIDMNRSLKILYGNCVAMILHVVTFAVAYTKLTINDLQEPRDSRESLLLMLNYIKDDLETTSKFTYSDTSDSILSFLWNYADKTTIVPNLIKVGYPKATLKWLSILTKCVVPTISKSEKPKLEAARPLISIVHNISRHDDGISVLNSLSAIDIVKEVQARTEDGEINILCCMILALLSTPEQIKNDRKHMNNALDELLQSVSTASKATDYKDGGFHISEPLVVLVKLFNDDRALDYILQHAQVDLGTSSTVEFFVNLLLKFHSTVSAADDPLQQLTCAALVNILWSVSFQEQYQYKRQLRNNQDCKILLEKLISENEISESTQYMPKYIENIQTAANGILLNISEHAAVAIAEDLPLSISLRRESVLPALVSQQPETEQSSNKPMIMISYSHDDKNLCYQLYDELKRKDQFDIWIDKDYCATGDSWENIALGIKQSNVVVCLITKNYDSKSIRREVIYALERAKKPMLPIFVRKPELPDWLDIRTCDLTHLKFADDTGLQEAEVSKLIKTVLQLISGTAVDGSPSAGSAPVHFESPGVKAPSEELREDLYKLESNSRATATNLSQKPIEEWNSADIQQWFKQKEILMELYKLCQFSNGSELLSFAKALLKEEQSQYHTYAKEFTRVYNGKPLLLHQFNKFTDALQKLIYEYDKQKPPPAIKPAITNAAPASTTAVTKSQACQIL